MRLVKTDHFKLRVTFKRPSEDADVQRQETYIGIYKRLPQAEVERIAEMLEDGEIALSDALDMIMEGAEGVEDADGNKLGPAEGLAGVKGDLWAARAGFQRFFDSLDQDRKAKNSKRPRSR